MKRFWLYNSETSNCIYFAELRFLSRKYSFVPESIQDILEGMSLILCFILKLIFMARNKNDVRILEKRVELLEMKFNELKAVDTDEIYKRIKSIEETLYSTKEVLNMTEVCQYLDISKSLLYKLTCNQEIPHFKPRGKMIFFEKKELVDWIKKNRHIGSVGDNELNSSEPIETNNNEVDIQEK